MRALAPLGIALFILALWPGRLVAGASCDDSAERKALKPYLQSPDAIIAKCGSTSAAPHSLVSCKGSGGKTEKLPACICTWRLLNACAEDYLSEKEKECRKASAALPGGEGQAGALQAVASRYRGIAEVNRQLAKKLRSCAESSAEAAKSHRAVNSRFARDQRIIEAALKASVTPQTVLAAPSIGDGR